MEPHCLNNTPPWFTGHWRDWHRGHGCPQDDGKPRTAAALAEMREYTNRGPTNHLTSAELRHLRARTTSGDTLLLRALDELAERRAAASDAAATFDHSRRLTKYFAPRLGYCVCDHCLSLPAELPTDYRCACGAAFASYLALAEHQRLKIPCPRCGAAPKDDLSTGDLFRWTCGHWIARDDPSAALRDTPAP